MPSINDDMCSSSASDTFDKEVETVFELHIEDSSSGFDIRSKSWAVYRDMATYTSGFICEKEGMSI